MNDIQTISAESFVDDRLRLYSAHSNIRAIPFIGDGFKQSQRKAAWGMLKRGENATLDTVERVGSWVASETDYHHGAAGMSGVIVSMAQDFTGSNNVPIFDKKGQFGVRLNKQASASRYIKTTLGKNFRLLFKKEDDLIFDHVVSNGMKVEPKFFTPLLPLVLVNGANGMGTGHSTYILSYNPEDLKKAILKVLDGGSLKAGTLLPWWKDFIGTVSRDKETDQVVVEGVYELKQARTSQIIITELPVGIQLDAYKNHLDKLEDRGVIQEYDNLSDKNGFEFVIKVPRETAKKKDAEIKKLFKLVSRETENLTVWNPDGELQRYENVEALLKDWITWRVDRYEARRLAMIAKIDSDMAWASLKIRFIRYYLANHKWFRDTPDKQLKAKLIEEGFDRHDELLAMAMRNLTHDKIKELEKDIDDLKALLKTLKTDTAVEMYKRELKELKI